MADYIDVMNKLDYLDDTKAQIKEAIIEKGQQITDETAFREYVAKILDIDAGRVKLYDTEADMYADTNVNAEDLALVYNTSFRDITYNSSFDNVAFYRNLTLGSSAVGNTYTLNAYSTISGNSLYVTVVGTSDENPATLTIETYNTKQRMNLTYKSIDASQKEFTFEYGHIDFNDGRTQEIEFNTDFILMDYDYTITWKSGSSTVFNRIFKVRSVYFGGVFQYKLNQLQDMTVYLGKNPAVDTENNKGNIEFTTWVDMNNINNRVLALSGKNTLYGMCVVNDMITNNNTNYMVNFDIYTNVTTMIRYNNVLYIYCTRNTNRESLDAYLNSHSFTKLNFDIQNNLYTETVLTPTIVEILVGTTTYYYAMLDTVEADTLMTNWAFLETSASPRSLSIADYDLTNTITNYIINMPNAYVDTYTPARSQLTVTGNSYIVTGKSAYGDRGIYTGDGTYLKHTTTREFRDFFMPQLPDTYDNLGDYGVIQTGQQVPIYSFVDRKRIKCTDVETIPSTDSVITKLEKITEGTYTSELFNTVYNATFHRTFYCEDDDRLYFGYFGYNMSDKESSSSTGGIIHEDFYQIYGILICLNDMSVYRICNYTTTWRPFSGWGNAYEDPNANLAYLNYDFINDEFIAVVDTGTWAWNSATAPFLAMLKIDGTTGEATQYRWQIGKNGVSNEYVQVKDVRYDITTENLIIPLSSWNSGNPLTVDRIIKMDLSGNKSLWVNNGYNLYGYSYLGDEESFYTLEPIYYYYYTDSNSTTHCILKRIDDDRELEIPMPYGWYADNTRCIYNGYLYFLNSNSTELNSNQFPVYKVDLADMSYTVVGTVANYTTTSFILYNRVPHIVYNHYIHSLADITEPVYLYFNSVKMYNDVRVDGVEVVEGNVQGLYPKVNINENGLEYYKVRQVLYHYSMPIRYNDIVNDVCLVWPNIGNGTYGTQYMYFSLLIGTGAAETLSQAEFYQARALVNSMLGGEPQVPSPEIQYIEECNNLANEIIGE